MLLIIHMKEVLKEIHIFLTKSRKKKIGQNKKRQSVLSIPHMKGESGNIDSRKEVVGRTEEKKKKTIQVFRLLLIGS